MLSADERERAADLIGELSALLTGAPTPGRYSLIGTRETDRRVVARARMHLDTASEQLERAVEYVAILEDRLEP